ncbi:hypothetical protein LINPERHAP1_LOCUS23337, partial [Linum perenne]
YPKSRNWERQFEASKSQLGLEEQIKEEVLIAM